MAVKRNNNVRGMDWLSPFRHLFEFALPVLDSVPLLRAGLAFAILFFLPGFAWTLVVFRQISIMERVMLSFGLSIATVTLSIFSMNLAFGVRITGFNSLLIVAFITAIPLGIYCFRHFREKVRHMAGTLPDE